MRVKSPWRGRTSPAVRQVPADQAWRLRSALFVMAGLVAASPCLGKMEDEQSRCGYALVERQSVPPAIDGPDDLVARAWVVPQPDSPVEIVAVDLSAMRVSFGLSSYEVHRGSTWTMDLRNRSDRVIESITVSVRLSVRPSVPGGGHGKTWEGALRPGETARIVCTVAGGGGSAGGQGEDSGVRLHLLVDKVQFDGCIYIPSQRYGPFGRPAHAETIARALVENRAGSTRIADE